MTDMDNISDIFWWTGSIVWMVIGGGVIVSFLWVASVAIGILALRYLRHATGDFKGIWDVHGWIKAGRPRGLSEITNDDILKADPLTPTRPAGSPQ